MRKNLIDLINEVKNGDDDSFALLCEEYRALIKKSSNSYFGLLPENCEASVEDLEQEAKLALYRAANTYNTEQNEVTFGLYSKTCIRNALISLVRKHSRKPKVSPSGEGSTSDDPLTGLISSENAEALMSKLGEILSEFEYKVFIMRSEGSTPKRIAAELGDSAKSVSNALFRARTKIREHYKNSN